MVRQMLFLDPPDHGRVRGLASKAFTPRRVEGLRAHIRDITSSLIDAVLDKGHMDVLADLAIPLPAIVTAEMLGVPTSDWKQLTSWSSDFAQVLGNFQHNPDRRLPGHSQPGGNGCLFPLLPSGSSSALRAMDLSAPISRRKSTAIASARKK